MNYPNTEFVVAGEKVNQKQMLFFENFHFLKQQDYRYFFYGGAIRGGKSYIILFILHLLALKHKGSKWVVVRDDLPNLKKTTIPSFLKMLGGFTNYHGKMFYGSPHTYKYKNGSEIQFIPESINQDKNLTDFLGLECNGFFLEQIEGLSEKMFDMAKQRAGSLYIEDMPEALIFSTFNPTSRWIKKEVYDKFVKGILQKPFFYMPALPVDNPHVTDDQKKAWLQMDSRSYKQMIESDWSIADIIDNKFYYAFNKSHVSTEPIKFNPTAPIWLFHDFNVNPLCAIVIQSDPYGKWMKVIKEYAIDNSSTFDICERIRKDYPSSVKFVHGDATGWNRSTQSKGLKSNYEIIQQELRLNYSQIKILKGAVNPPHELTRSIGNMAFEKLDILIDASCVVLINDLETAQADSRGKLVKEGNTENGKHALDCLRYALYYTFGRK